MDEVAIFEHLFVAAKESKDSKGVATACLVVDGEIIHTAASSDDGGEHAENVLLDSVAEVPVKAVLYTTLEPCYVRSNPDQTDCVTCIIENGVRTVVFGARDPSQSEGTCQRLKEAGVEMRQAQDPEVVRKCAEVFNQSVEPGRIGVDVDLKPLV